MPNCGKPAMSRLMVDVRRIEQGHKYVSVEKIRHSAPSRRLLTNARSLAGAPKTGGKTGTPLRIDLWAPSLACVGPAGLLSTFTVTSIPSGSETPGGRTITSPTTL